MRAYKYSNDFCSQAHINYGHESHTCKCFVTQINSLLKNGVFQITTRQIYLTRKKKLQNQIQLICSIRSSVMLCIDSVGHISMSYIRSSGTSMKDFQSFRTF